jgi:DNA-binding CsgD family transcriptional regulator
MTRRPHCFPGRATDRGLAVVVAVLDAGSETATAHRLGTSHVTVKHHLANARSKVGAVTTAQLVGMLAALPKPDAGAPTVRRLSARRAERPPIVSRDAADPR